MLQNTMSTRPYGLSGELESRFPSKNETNQGNNSEMGQEQTNYNTV